MSGPNQASNKNLTTNSCTTITGTTTPDKAEGLSAPYNCQEIIESHRMSHDAFSATVLPTDAIGDGDGNPFLLKAVVPSFWTLPTTVGAEVYSLYSKPPPAAILIPTDSVPTTILTVSHPPPTPPSARCPITTFPTQGAIQHTCFRDDAMGPCLGSYSPYVPSMQSSQAKLCVTKEGTFDVGYEAEQEKLCPPSISSKRGEIIHPLLVLMEEGRVWGGRDAGFTHAPPIFNDTYGRCGVDVLEEGFQHACFEASQHGRRKSPTQKQQPQLCDSTPTTTTVHGMSMSSIATPIGISLLCPTIYSDHVSAAEAAVRVDVPYTDSSYCAFSSLRFD